MFRRWGVAVTGMLLVTVALATAFVTVPGLGAFARETVTFESASGLSHLEDWSEGVRQLEEHPLGVGLGAGGLTAARFGLPAIATDSQYFKYSVEMGILGLAFYFATLATLLAAAGRAYTSSRSSMLQTYAALTTVTVLGIALNGLTTVPLYQPVLTYPFFWIAGAVVSAHDKEASA